MFKYYCTLLFWQRIYQIENEGSECDYLILFRSLGETAVPDDVQCYLDGIGNVTDNEGETWQFQAKSHPTAVVHNHATGSFGQVDADTHILYETMPAPIIPLLNIAADVKMTIIGGPSAWDLPASLTPATNVHQPQEDGKPNCVAPGHPTKNLLGYARAGKLTDDQMDVLINHGIQINRNNGDIEGFNIRTLDGIPINQSLVAYINSQLRNSKCSTKVYNQTDVSGALSQLPFTLRVASDLEPETNRSIGEKLGTTKSYQQNTAFIASAAATFRYRIKRMMNLHTVDCFCYFFPNLKGSVISRKHG